MGYTCVKFNLSNMKKIAVMLSLFAFLMVGCSSGTEKKVQESQQKGDQQYDDLLKNLEQKTKSDKNNQQKAPKKDQAATQKSE